MTSPASAALSEHESKQLLAKHGLRVAAERLVPDPAAAAAAADELGYPVVVKLCGRAILHKTELDAVRLGLTDAAGVTAAGAELLAAAPSGAAVELLVAEQVRGRRELIAGVTRDPAFGLTLMLGVGGILAEAVADVTFRLLPASRADLAGMLDDLVLQRLLGPFRSEPPVDRDAVTDALVAIAACAVTEAGIDAIDVNPLIISDGRPVAVDALVVLAAESGEGRR